MKSIFFSFFICLLLTIMNGHAQHQRRNLFTNNWKFLLDSTHSYEAINVNDAPWRKLNLPHDWSIEGTF
ncbi:MAG: hypothetical protein ICV79_08445, partial [Flavisolibacter sp.]|nr:hypothetical protein [Flavisolibacter sp.]